MASPATGTTATYSYNADSQVSGISNGSGKDTRSFGYDGLRRLTSDTLKTASGTTIASLGYGYSPGGLLTSETTTGLAGPASSTYTYDQAGRLASWSNGSATTAYAYDGNGNLTQDGSKTLTYDARDELTSDGTASYGYTARGTPASQSSPSGTVAVTFDAYGDQAAAGARAYAYDALGRLAADTAAGGGGYQFSYAGATGAVASDGTSAYTWDPAGRALVATGAPGGGTGGALALTDLHGNQAGQFTAAGTTLAGSRSYDPWGSPTATSGTVTGLLGYQSAWADPASGKDLTGARWYNPGAGDFTSADTIVQSPLPDPAAGNPFAYAADNPLTGTDPTGHMTDAAELANDKAAATAAAAKTAAAQIPTYCAAGSNLPMGAVGTCLQAVYKAAGGTVTVTGTPTTSSTKGSTSTTGTGYDPSLAAAALGIVQDQYNAVQDATQKRDAQDAAARSQAASRPLCGTMMMHTVGGVCTIEQLAPPRPGGSISFLAGVGSDIVSMATTALCAGNLVSCLANQGLGFPSPDSLYQSWLHSQGVDTNPDSTYRGGQVSGDLILAAAGGALGAAGAAADAAPALSDIAPEEGRAMFSSGSALSNADVVASGAGLARTSATVENIAARAGVNLEGSTVQIIEDPEYIRYLDSPLVGACACAPYDLPGEIHLGPASFIDEQTLAATLAHEQEHILQYAAGYIPGSGDNEIMEAAARAVEGPAVARLLGVTP